MTFRTPLWTQGASHDADVLRQFVAATLVDGVPGGSDLAVTQRGAGANMSVDVAAGRVVIDDYVCWSDAVVNLGIGAPPGAGQSRIDSVQAIVTDDNSGTGAWAVTVVPGTSSASPSPPAVPSTGVELARVTSTSSTTSITSANIADRRPSAVRPPYRTTLPATGLEGQVISLPGGSLAVRSSGAWIVHEPQESWPQIFEETSAGPDTFAVGTTGIRAVPLPANRDLKVVSTLTVNADAVGGTNSLVQVYLRITGTGLTTITSALSEQVVVTNALGGGRTMVATLTTPVPACPDPVITSRAFVTNASAKLSGLAMSVMVFPA